MIIYRYWIVAFMMLLLIPFTNTVTTGSCAKYALDGETCEMCIDHYHLQEGQCYVDILGCKQYTFGNICKQCQNGYIMFNNMCCDEQCMARTLKRHISENKTKMISKHFQILSKVIPEIAQRYIRNSLSSLVEIDYESYNNVERYVILYEFYENQFRRYRAVVDYLKQSNQIVVADWAKLLLNEDMLSFQNRLQIPKDKYQQILNKFHPLYQDFNIETQHFKIKKSGLNLVQQYEIYSEDKNKKLISVRTLYNYNQKNIILIDQETRLVVFQPYEKTYLGEQLSKLETDNNIYRRVSSILKTNSKYHPQIISVKIKADTELIIHFIVVTENTTMTTAFFVDFYKDTDEIKINDIQMKGKQVIPEPQQTEKQKQITQIVDQVKQQLQKDKEEQKDDTQQKICEQVEEKQQEKTQPIPVAEQNQKKEQLEEKRQIVQEYKIIKNLSEKQLNIINFIMVQYLQLKDWKPIRFWFNPKFSTYEEVTVILTKNHQYKYVYIMRMLASQQFILWGIQEVKRPSLDSSQHLALNNPQQIKTKSQLDQNLIDFVQQEIPQSKNMPILKAKIRQFPNLFRFSIIIRLNTSKIEVIIHQTKHQYSIFEKSVLQDNLPPRNKQQTKKQQEIQELYQQKKEQKSEENIQKCHSKQTKQQQEEEAQQNLLILNAIRQENQQLTEIQLLKMWKRKPFKTYLQVTTLVKSRKTFYYYYFEQNIQKKTINYIGKQQTQAPIVNNKGEFKLMNPQKLINKMQIDAQQVIKTISFEHPLSAKASQQSIKVYKRQFPSYVRFYVKMTVGSVDAQYVLHKNSELYKIVQYTQLQNHEEKPKQQVLTPSQKEQIQQVITEQFEQQEHQEIQQQAIPQKHSQIIEFLITQQPAVTKQSKILFILQREPFETYRQVTIFTQRQNIKSIHWIMVGLDNHTNYYWGSKIVKQFPKNAKNKYTNPNPQIKVSPQKISQQFPQLVNFIQKQRQSVVNGTIENILQRKFPFATRYLLFVRLQKSRVRYVIHQREGEYKLVEQKILKDNLKPINKKDQGIIRQIIEQYTETEESIQQEIEEIKISETKIVQFIHSIKQQTVSFQQVTIFRRKSFTTFQQITVLVKIENLYVYYFLIYDFPTQQFTYLGNTITQQPANNKNGELTIPNLQRNIHVSKVSKVIQFINFLYPQTVNKPIKKVLVRKFPSISRIIVIYRFETTSRRFILIQNSTNFILKQNSIYQTDLKPLTEQEEQKLINEANIEAQLDIQKESEEKQTQQIITKNTTSTYFKYEFTNQWTEEVSSTIISIVKQKQPAVDRSQQILTVWRLSSICNIQEYTLLAKISDGHYKYIYFSYNIQTKQANFIGIQDAQAKNDQQALLLGIHNVGQMIKKSSAKKIINSIHKNFPQTVGKKILSVFERDFKQIIRYDVAIRLDNRIERYLVYDTAKQNQAISISHCPLVQNLTKNNQQEELVIEIIQQQKQKEQTPQENPEQPRCTLENMQNYVKNKNLQISSLTLISSSIQKLSNKTLFELTYGSETSQIKIKVIANCKGLQPEDYELQSLKREQISQTLSEKAEEIIQKVEEKQTEQFIPVDPNIMYYPKANQILNQIPLSAGQSPVNLDNLDQNIQDVVLFIRTKYEIVRKGSIIKILHSQLSVKIHQYVIYFFVAANKDHPTYRVYEAVVNRVNQADNYQNQVQTFKLVIDENKLVQGIAQQNQLDDVSIAYGYKQMDPVEVAHNFDIKIIQKQIRNRYFSILRETTIYKVYYLQLKDGRINYKIQFKSQIGNHMQVTKFVIFYEPKLQRVLLLNAICGAQAQQAQQLSTSQQNADQLLRIIKNKLEELHQNQMPNNGYKIIGVGKIQQAEGVQYHIQIQNQQKGSKYRSIVKSDLQGQDIKQFSWNQIVQISLDHYRLDEFEQSFIANFQKLTDKQLLSNSNFKLVSSYASRQDKRIANSTLIGASLKPSGFGFIYRIYYLENTGTLLRIEIYIESYSEKVKILSSKNIDFIEGFTPLTTSDKAIDKIVASLRLKVEFKTEQFIIKSASGKQFLFGNLYKLAIQFPDNRNSHVYEALLYHDHTTQQIDLLQWKIMRESGVCTLHETDQNSICLQCENNAPIVDGICTIGVKNCRIYVGTSEMCNQCETGYILINNICSKDCGPICLTHSLP